MVSKPRGDMGPEELARARRLNKRSATMRKLGKPVIVYQHEHDEARDKVRELNKRGMSILQMAEQTGLSTTFFSDRLNGRVKGTRRSAYDIVMRMHYEDTIRRPGMRVAGAKIDGTGTRRRLQALLRIGFSGLFLGPLMDCSQQRISVIVNGESFVYGYTAVRVRELYDKYNMVDPRDLGVSELAYRRTISSATRRGFAPPGAWDDETIDDPEAHAEWTGQCGRMAGVLIHLREGQFGLCDPCIRVTENVHGNNKVDPYRLYEINQLGKSHAESAQLLGISKDLYSQYAQYLRAEERRIHTLSMVDKTAMIGYCDACRETVKLYASTGTKVVCSNGVKKYRGEKGI